MAAPRYGSPLKRAVTFYVPLTVMVGTTLFPFYWMVITSVRPDVELYNVKMNPFFTLHPTLNHFYYLFELTMFPRWAWNTLARLQFRWAPSLGTVIFITYLVPPTLLFIPLGDVVKAFGIGDTPWAVILTYPTFLIPFCTWLLMGYFKTIPREIEDCARIDGASRIQAMVRISFPLAVPGILSAGLVAFTLSSNEFLYALVFLASPQQKTIPIGVFTELVRGDVFYWGPLMAGALLGSIPVALVYSFFVEHYVTALTGAVKG